MTTRDALVSRVAELYAMWLSTPTDRDSKAIAALRKAEWQTARADLREYDATHDTPTEGAAS
jgi:hypothetical protein